MGKMNTEHTRRGKASLHSAVSVAFTIPAAPECGAFDQLDSSRPLGSVVC
jgi:hypothetical protein